MEKPADTPRRPTSYPPVLTAEEVAELLALNIDTVRRLAREEVIPSHRIPGGRTFRFLTDEVLDWLREQPDRRESSSSQPFVGWSRTFELTTACCRLGWFSATK